MFGLGQTQVRVSKREVKPSLEPQENLLKAIARTRPCFWPTLDVFFDHVGFHFGVFSTILRPNVDPRPSPNPSSSLHRSRTPFLALQSDKAGNPSPPPPPKGSVGGTRTCVLGLGKSTHWVLRTDFGVGNRTLWQNEFSWGG